MGTIVPSMAQSAPGEMIVINKFQSLKGEGHPSSTVKRVSR
jgi:hypothetical protein